MAQQEYSAGSRRRIEIARPGGEELAPQRHVPRTWAGMEALRGPSEGGREGD